jgi:hypothetical protein
VVNGYSFHRQKVETIHPLAIRVLQTPIVVWRVIRNERRGIAMRTAIPILLAIPLEASGATRRLEETRNAFEIFDSVFRLGAASTLTPFGKTADRVPSARLRLIDEPLTSFDARARTDPIDLHGVLIFCYPRFIEEL